MGFTLKSANCVLPIDFSLIHCDINVMDDLLSPV